MLLFMFIFFSFQNLLLKEWSRKNNILFFKNTLDGQAKFFRSPQIENPQIQSTNSPQLSLSKRSSKSSFYNDFIICTNLLQHYMLYFWEEKACIFVLAEILSPQRS
jgi:hypothetical protein